MAYEDVIRIESYLERLEAIKKSAKLRVERSHTLNSFYTSAMWKLIRQKILLRDNFCDLAHPNYKLASPAQVHHIDPITEEDVLNSNPKIYAETNLITVSHTTHNLIHCKTKLPFITEERTKDGDLLWTKRY